MPCTGAFPFAYCTKTILCLALAHFHLLIATRPFYASCWRTPICSSLQGHCLSVRPSSFYCCTVMVCFYQALRCWVLNYQEPSSFALLGTHSSLSPEHSYCYCTKATIYCNSSLFLATHAPHFLQRFLGSRKPSATVMLLPFWCKYNCH